MESRLIRYIKILVPLVVLLLLFAYIYLFVYGSTTSPNSLKIKSITVSDNKVTIMGSDIADSALAYAGYSLKLVEDKLYVKPRFSLVSKFNKASQFKIIYNTKNKVVNKVYLQGADKNNVKLIWSVK